MKEFLKYTLATITGIIVVSAAMTVIGIISLVGMIASEQAKPSVKDNSVFVLSLSGLLEERAQDNVMSQLTGGENPYMGLDDVTNAIRKAKENNKIKGIYIEAGMFGSDSPASAQAIRKQLEDFKESGKWIVAYADTYTQMTYYICSVADRVYLNPHGMLDWHGLAAQPVFLKDLLGKFGVKMQLAKVGKYKSAPETFTADKMSEPNRQQVAAYIGGTWDVMLADVARSRKLPKATLNQYADSLVALADPTAYLNMKLVDKLLYSDEMRSEVKRLLGTGEGRSINQLTLDDMKLLPETKKTKGEKVAVYYAYGDVVDTNPGGLSSSPCIAADAVCKDIERLADDDDIKAVVLRVNSGGGSAYASEQIWHAVSRLKERKPVVVSMGGMAASGGYYLGCAANYIYAEPTTLTGSIGIFGMFPDFSGLLTSKLGIKFDEVKTNRHSAFGTPARPLNAEEMAYIDAYIERGYRLFISRVAQGRKMTAAQVDSLAQGRVWLGSDALHRKLIDGLGGLPDAVAKAAKLAKLADYHTQAYPAQPSWMDQLMEASASGGSYLDGRLRLLLGEYYAPLEFVGGLDRHNCIQARLPFNLTIK